VLGFAADREAGADRLQARAGYMHAQGQPGECWVVSDLQRTSRRHIQRRAEHRQAPHHAFEHVQAAVLGFAADREAGADRLQARAGYMHAQGQPGECWVVAGLQQQFAAQQMQGAVAVADVDGHFATGVEPQLAAIGQRPMTGAPGSSALRLQVALRLQPVQAEKRDRTDAERAA
jgi:hypothetical protein